MRHNINDAVFDDEVGRIALPDQTIIDVEPLLMDQYRQGHHIMDAGGLVFFSRQLTLIKARTYDTKYAELKARMMFPVNNEGGPGIQSIKYRQFDQVGQARIINAYADDLPRADVSAMPEQDSPVRSIGVSYGYNHDEIMAARQGNFPLDVGKARAAMRANEQEINRIAFFGDEAHGMTGFFNHPNIPQGAVVDPGSGTEWANKTAEQILFDINDGAADIWAGTNMVERPNKLALPPNQHSFITSHPRSTTSDTTIAQFIVQNSQYLNSIDDIIPLNELVEANNPSLAGLGDAMIWFKQDPETMELQIPVELEMFPVQMRNLEYVVPARSRVAGLVIRYPLAVSILTGI